ncbi:MAG TPA: hypothetical protein VKY74_12505 [Chloroflexia bacterium]|nr:hypothetical protein [Chloroflexia bacterium]
MTRAFRIVALLFLALAASLPGRPAPSAAAAPAAGNACWTAEASPLPAGTYAALAGVAARTPTDVWTVGLTWAAGGAHPLIEHGDGQHWTVQPDPVAGDTGLLSGVTAFAADDAWAVGATTPGDNSQALIVHWDGQHWQRSDLNLVTTSGDRLAAIGGSGPTDLWAVGTNASGPHHATLTPVILHGDGTTWRPVTLPGTLANDEGDPLENSLTAISARTPDDVWVTGSVILHWDGRIWQVVPAPASDLLGITALAPDDVWAVGARSGDSGAQILHWDGTAFHDVPIPNRGGGSTGLAAVAAVSPQDIWAVGPAWAPAPGVALHWDGTAWSPMAVPIPAGDTQIAAVAALPSGTVWMAGTHTPDGNNGTQTERVLLHGVPCTPEPVPIPGSGSQTFPETGQTVSGLFLDYWRNHGGLVQQGYPLSPVLSEVSPLDGRSYSVQYFERAVFEYHPEYAGTPAAVLLSQLGTFAYQQHYPQGAPSQQVDSVNPRHFSETGRTLGGVFRTYWEQHGGLAQQGYPISDEFLERSPLNGQVYRVQYFERAVFEDHPENAGTPYRVLLSQLGTLRYQARTTPGAGLPRQTDLTAVALAAPDAGWAVGQQGTILQYAGGRWAAAPSPVNSTLWGVALTSADEGWAVGDAGVVLHLTAGRWLPIPSPAPNATLSAIQMRSPTDGWITGWDSSGGLLLHYSGATWQPVALLLHYSGATWQPVARPPAPALFALSMVGPAEGWAVGQAGVLLHYRAGGWETQPLPESRVAAGVAMVSPQDGWAADDTGTLLRYQSGAWTVAARVTGQPVRVRMLSASEGWAVGYSGTLLHYTAGAWISVPAPTTANLADVAFVDPAAGWAVGAGGTLLHYHAGIWTAAAPPGP